MKHRSVFSLLLTLCASQLAACPSPNPVDSGTQNSDDVRDAAASIDVVSPEDVPSPLTDMPSSDVGNATDASVAVDSGPQTDAGTAADAATNINDILGTLAGSCPAVRAQLHTNTPSLIRNNLRFMLPERYERAALSMGGQRLFDTPNAGGSSIESEVMSFEVLHFCDNALLAATETEIHYQPPDDSGANSITDLLVTIGGERVGVSVTRVYRPMPMVLSDAEVRAQLVTKLTGVNRSSIRVLPADRWIKQILHVFVANSTVGDQVERAWATIDAPTRADTIVLVTVTQGGGFIYCNPDPPLGSECPAI